VQQNWRRLKTELQAYAALRGRTDIQLASFLAEQAIELDDLYRSSGRSGCRGWRMYRSAFGRCLAYQLHISFCPSLSTRYRSG